VEGVADPDRPSLPAPALICARHPHHDITNREADATTCPQPRCGGTLIQLECGINLTHDVSQRASDQFTCPVCGGPLMTPFCTFDRTHSMVGRNAGQTTCPIAACAHTVARARYMPWWLRAKLWFAGLWSGINRRLAALVIGIAAVVGLVFIAIWYLQPRPTGECDEVPKDARQAVELASKRIQARISADKAEEFARLDLKCGSPDPALLLLRYAYENGDGEAARMLGLMTDPTAGADVAGRQTPNERRAVEWYARAVKLRNTAARADLERLLASLKAAAGNGDPERAEAINIGQDALRGNQP
jgi:hypothetical protein